MSAIKLYELAHEILVLIVYVQEPPLNTYTDVSRGARALKFGLSLHLHLYFMQTSIEDSGECAHLCRLARAFNA